MAIRLDGESYVFDFGIPQGAQGATPSIDETVDSVIERVPPTRLQFLNSDGSVFDEQQARFGGTFRIPPVTMRIIDGRESFQQSRALGGDPITIEVEGLIDASR